jgi:hypothetical protein
VTYALATVPLVLVLAAAAWSRWVAERWGR